MSEWELVPRQQADDGIVAAGEFPFAAFPSQQVSKCGCSHQKDRQRAGDGDVANLKPSRRATTWIAIPAQSTKISSPPRK